MANREYAVTPKEQRDLMREHGLTLEQLLSALGELAERLAKAEPVKSATKMKAHIKAACMAAAQTLPA